MKLQEKKKKRLLFCSKNLEIGGMEKALVLLLNRLDFDRYDITLLLESAKGPLFSNLDPRVKVLSYSVASGKNALLRKAKNAVRFLNYCRKHQNQFDFSCCYATYSNACSKLSLVSSRNSSLYVHSDYLGVYGGDHERASLFFDTIRLSSFRRVAFVSEQAKKSAEAVCPQALWDRFRLIGNLCDTTEIRKQADFQPETEIPQQEGKTVFLFVGRMQEESKRVLRLLEAIRQLKERRQDFVIWLVGDGEDLERYRKFAKENGLSEQVVFFGAVENPYPYMKACGAVVLASDYEGFPMIYAEAAALGKTLITTVPARDDAFFVDETNAIIVEKTAESLCAAMDAFCSGGKLALDAPIDLEKANRIHLNSIYSIIENED